MRYTLKDTNEITFNVADSRKHINPVKFNDYPAQLAKNYFLKYINDNEISSIHLEESYYQQYGTSFLKCKLYTNIEQYPQLEKTAIKMNNLFQGMRKDTKYGWAEFYIYLNDFEIEISNWYHIDDDEAVYNSKVNYINYLKNSNHTDITVPQEDYDEYWHPDELEIIFNGEQIYDYDAHTGKNYPIYARYNTSSKEYVFLMNSIIEHIPNIENIDITGNTLNGFTYNKNKMKFVRDDKIARKNEVHLSCTETEFKEIFNAKIYLNYTEHKIYVEFE